MRSSYLADELGLRGVGEVGRALALRVGQQALLEGAALGQGVGVEEDHAAVRPVGHTGMTVNRVFIMFRLVRSTHLRMSSSHDGDCPFGRMSRRRSRRGAGSMARPTRAASPQRNCRHAKQGRKGVREGEGG